MVVVLLWLAPTIAAGGVIYVDVNTPDNNDGSSWGKAYKYLQDALDNAVADDEIWVAAGTYKPDDDDANDPNGSGLQTATFQLINGVAIYGGFAGGESSLDERDWQTNVTILSGDINTPGDNADNSYHVATANGVDSNTILDGFTITAGNANGGSYPCSFGGGMFNYKASPTLSNCMFTGNTADSYGGGICCASYSSPMIVNCTISGNSANIYAGGIHCEQYSNPTITNCTITDNSATYCAGGIFCENHSSPTISKCTVSGNSADAYGGAIYCYWYSSPTISNCTISHNTTDLGGGISCDYYSSPTISNCAIIGNGAVWGGGIYCGDYSGPTISNCTLSANTATVGGGICLLYNCSGTVVNSVLWGDTADSGPEIALGGDPSTLAISYSDVQGGRDAALVSPGSTLDWGTGNIAAGPNFVDANNPDPNLRDYHLRPGSPCIDAGDNNSLPPDTPDLDGDGNTTELIPFDIDTDVRVSNVRVDMGSDEVIWASAEDVNQGESVMLNPGGGPNDPNTESLVVFENVSGPNDAAISVTEVGMDVHLNAAGLFSALGKTIRIDTSLADGEFFMTISIPFDANDLNGQDPFAVDLMYWDEAAGKWRHAVRDNTNPQQSNPKKNRWQEEYAPTPAPTLASLKARGMGANGVFWNNDTQQGFVWANVDHTTDFEGLIHNIADFEPDGDVDFGDFSAFALKWQNTDCGLCEGADLTGDGNVDANDLRELSDNWLFGP